MQVCGQRGHRAGFVGATYLDCPNKPCYLCKQLGHTTTTCPYRILPGHGCTAAATAGGGGGGRRGGLMSSLQGRECSGRCVDSGAVAGAGNCRQGFDLVPVGDGLTLSNLPCAYIRTKLSTWVG